ncbi:MAG: AAC(3) family N-acetyltransferase [Candidatus Latescibacterota bacterium]
MPVPVPPSLRRFCRQTVPLLLGRTSGATMRQAVTEVVATDRWNSFDRFRQTTQTLLRRYEQAGARAEVFPVQTGGWIGTGRWIIQEAADVAGATADVVAPVQRRLLDWCENPWHVVQWSAATPASGLQGPLVILDTREEVTRLARGALWGRVVLTCLDPRPLLGLLADRGAVAVITDRPVPNHPDAVAWTKFGWGAVSMADATARLAGFAVSANQGKALRQLAGEHGELTLQVRADVRKYVGTHDVVSGLVVGRDDPQDEVWAIAHSGEPGAIDNASGVAVCLEIARVLEELIGAGQLPRPRRTIRLLNAYECYGFFAYLERVRRLQPPLAGVCIDSVGARPPVCAGRLEWHATIPMSAGFVDRVGEVLLRDVLRRHRPGYRLCLEPFVSTSDTLIGDPQYGYPCPWITTHHQGNGRGFDAYHSSADTVDLLSDRGLEACAAGMAAYLYLLADMGTAEVLEVASWETQRVAEALGQTGTEAAQVEMLRQVHATNLGRLQRWLWGGDRPALMSHLDECARQVDKACERIAGARVRHRVPAAARRVPRRTAPLSPTTENVPAGMVERLNAGPRPWTLFWADGRRDIAAIALLAAEERTAAVGSGPQRAEVDLRQLVGYFEALAELGYVHLAEPEEMVRRPQLVRDLRALGLRPGMDVMVHTSLSAIGTVEGGAQTVVDALLQAIGPRGTLMAPSFNHRAAEVYNPLTTPTTNGAIPEAVWRRREARRSLHPTHPVACIGPRAEEFCRGHLEAGIWAQDSPIGKLVHGGGYILALGTTHDTSTAQHVAEMSVPCRCIDMFGNAEKVLMPDDTVQRVRGLAWRNGACPVPTRRMDEALDARGLQRRGRVGNAECEFVRALDLWEVRREHVRDVCPTCPVRPRLDRP